MTSKKTLRLLLLVAAFVTAPLLLFSFPPHPHEGSSIIGRVWHEVVYPVEYSWHWLTSTAATTWRHYIFLTDTAQKNDELNQRVNVLSLRIRDLEDQALENQRLRKLVHFADRLETPLLIAQVVSSSRGQPFQSIRINRGTTSDLRPGMPVVVAEGVVGKILRLGYNHADVQLITDPNSYLDVLIERTRTRGILRGLDGKQCRLHVHRESDIRIGDTVITSGLVGAMPKGLSVGKIVKIAYESDNVSQIVTIHPWVAVDDLEEVLIMDRDDPEVARIIQTAGEEWIEKTLGGPDRG